MTPSRPDHSTLTDDELIRLIRGGETDAFEELVRRTSRPAYRLARRITRNHEDADDVVQESFVKAYQALDRFQLGKAIAPWVLTIVARTALSSVRQSKRRAASALDEPGPDGSAPLSERVADPAANPAALTRRLEVERAFETLSEEHRVILTLRVEGDLPYASIAEALGIPVGTVMSRLARAREALIEAMSQRKVVLDES
ncbi:MAG TPA: RNA polymerase sigma factor [Candidatus Eisenbacteria bacterium]|nr:RNA polymerase sigma factor [Candidatus Eisenbacteria bacterium]